MKVSPQNPRSMRTRRLLHHALIRLATEKNSTTISIGDVAQEAGIHRSTFYLHYSGLPELFEDCAKELFRQLREDIYSSSSVWVPMNITQMAPYVAIVFHHLETYELFYRAILGRHGDPLFRALFQEEISGLLLEPKGKSDMNPHREMILRFFSAGFTEIAVWWLENRKPFSADEAAALVVKDLLTDYARFIYS